MPQKCSMIDEAIKQLEAIKQNVSGPRKRPRDRRDDKAVGGDKEERNTRMVQLFTEQLLNLDANDTAMATKRQKTEKAPRIAGATKALKKADLKNLQKVCGKLAEGVNKYRASVEEANSDVFTDTSKGQCEDEGKKEPRSSETLPSSKN